ncbi:Exocyst complex component SEC8 [Spathaspora sp. JA1]|nr:Exocyst complex component SEC8 [Spathaspora sp. JA1]
MTTRRLSFSMPTRGSRKSQAMDDAVSELKQIYDGIRYDWPQILDNKSPIETAIALLDDSSVGLAHRLPEFEHLKHKTESGLRNVVHEHHETFNNSIGSYHMLLTTLHESQSDSHEIKRYLESSNKEMHDRSDQLSELSSTSGRYSQLIDVLDSMTELTQIPERIDQLVIDKKIHQVYDVISHGYKVAEKYNLWSLPAMIGIQNYLESQSNKLFDMIIDELQNEIYIKQTRGNSQSVFNSPAPQLASLVSLVNSTNLEQYVNNAGNLDINEIVNYLSQPVEKFIKTQLQELHQSSSNTLASDDQLVFNFNSSTSSFNYIYMLLRTASKLGRLNQVMAILVDSNQSELHGLITRTTEEIKSKHAIQLSKLTKVHHQQNKSTLLDIMGNANFQDSCVNILTDLFGAIFVKCLEVFYRHKVVHEIVAMIEQGQNISNTSMASPTTPTKTKRLDGEILTIWNVIKKELRSVMLNYIYDENQVMLDPATTNTTTSRTKDQSMIYKVMTNKNNLFKLQDVSYDNTATELLGIVSDIFPGFTGMSITPTSNSSPYVQTESFNALIDVIVPKNLFNMRIILEFFLIFIEGSHRVFVNFENDQTNLPNSNSCLQFFHDFMRISFMGYIKELVEISFSEQVGGTYIRDVPTTSGLKLDVISLNQDIKVLDQTITSGANSNVVIYENAFNFKKLYLELCLLFNTSLTYRPDYSDIVLRVLDNFSKEYTNLYHELLSSSGENNQINKWMNIPTLTEITGKILQVNVKNKLELIQAECQIMLFQNNDVEKEDLLDQESYSQVLYLLLTSSWILSWLPLIKKESSKQEESVQISTIDKLRNNWSFLENGRMSINFTANTSDIIHNNVFLCLSPEKLSQFDEILHNFETIRDGTLLGLRYDLRCKAIYYITNSYKHQDWWTPSNEPSDADHYIGLFNQQVFAVDNKLATMLNDIERETIFIGLSKFLNDLFIQGSNNLKKVNSNGIKRILLNISTVQQMLRSVANNPELIDFTKSSKYFEMFTLNEFTLVNRIKQGGYTKADYKNLARLIYSEKLADGNGTSFNKGKYSDLLTKIDEFIE